MSKTKREKEALKYYRANKKACEVGVVGAPVLDFALKIIDDYQEKPKPKRAYKRRKPAVAPELSAKRRAASLTQWEGHERTPYKTIRLSVRAVDMIRKYAALCGVSASQAVIDAIENSAIALCKN